MASHTPLTVEGLAEVLQRHIEATAARFRDVEDQIQSLVGRFEDVDRHIQTLVGQVEALFGLVRDQGLRMTALAEQVAEQQTQSRQILHRLEQHDARFEQHSARLEQHDLYIRRMLDLLERRGGDGGSRPT